MGQHYRDKILPIVLELKTQGYSHQMISEELGYTYEQIKKLVYRYNKSQRVLPHIPAKRGRPKKRPLTTEADYQARIKRLEMENELLRSFLQAAGRM